MASNSPRTRISRELLSIRYVPTLLVFIIIVLVFGFSWRTSENAVVETMDEQVDMRSQFVESDIKQRVSIYTNALRSAAGFIESSDDVSRQEWSHFARSLKLGEQLPATDSLAYATTSASNLRDAEILYIEPSDSANSNLIGLNIDADPQLNQIMAQTRDSGQAIMSGSHSLSNNQSAKNLLIFYPVYSAHSSNDQAILRANIRGFVLMSLDLNNLFSNLLMGTTSSLNFQIFENETISQDSMLYSRPGNNPSRNFMEVKSSQINLNNQTWTINYSANADIVPHTIRQRPRVIAFAGLIFASVVSALVYTLMQRRTRQIAERETKKIENAKDSLLSIASHQLRTPATGVKQYLGMVLEGFSGDLTKDQKQLLGKAYDSNERQLHIINEFLYLAKADAGRVIVSPQVFDIGELVRQIVSDMQSNILEAGHTTKIVQRAKIVNVYADPHSARMIIENLISNAVKYTPNGGKITISTVKHLNEGLVKVSDNGVGIDRKDFKKLYRQFSRIPNALSKQTSGSGIGLYLAKYLAKLNGGNITLRSKPQAGSTFTLSLPSKPTRKTK